MVAEFAIPALWLAWCVYWFIAARDVKATARRESSGARFLHVAPLVLSALLFMLPPRQLPAVLHHRWLPLSWTVYWSGVALVAAGLAFAAWARLHLGRNWSGVVSLKEGHELITTGPYRLVRNPIYSGLSLAFLGSAISWGDWRGLVAFACAMLAIVPRVVAEDRLMGAAFGDEYVRYRARTKVLIPFLL